MPRFSLKLTFRWQPCLPRQFKALGFSGLPHPALSALGWMFGSWGPSMALSHAPLQIDLIDQFASQKSSQCPQWYSLTEVPLGTDTQVHSWPRGLRKYAFLQVSLIAQTQSQGGYGTGPDGRRHIVPTRPGSRSSWHQPLPGR